MSAPARPDVHTCTRCRLRFTSRRSLRRHEAMDHQPAPDGARLTAQLLEGLGSELEPRAAACDDGAAAPVLLEDPARAPAPRPRPPSALRPAPVRPQVTVLVVVALVGLLLGHEPVVALGAAVLAWALCCARSAPAGRRTGERRAADG